ncbi:MAG TPA: glycosyltransferase, partial [Ktedonobacteraceae bacterium]|nr:glycosyltransferase [Ktedonobacteraceae bacterium]
MKIGINSLFFQFPNSGSGQYLSHLIRALSEVDEENEYILLGPHPLPRGDNRLSSFSYLAKPVPGFAANNENVAKLIWEQFTAPAAARKAGLDIFHVPYFAPPYFPRTPTVVTIHDVIPLRLPLYRAGAAVNGYMKLVAHAAHKATLVIAVSQHAKQDMVDMLHLPAERIRVIYEAAGDEYHPVSDATKLAEVRKRYGVNSRYIFYLGG